MMAMFEKELRSLLTGLIGPLMIGAILAVLTLYFVFNNLIGASTDISVPMNAAAVLALTFAVPFLCMRTFAEERRTGTDQLFLTAPVSIGAIVAGKFLAIAALLLIPVAIACLFPLILSPFGQVQYLFCYTAILGFYLYALMITAIAMFVSTLTSNQFVAGIFSFLFILLGVILGSAYNSISVQPVRSFLKTVYDFNARIAGMMGGLFDWTSVVYFVSVTGLFLFLCTQSVLKRRYTLKKGRLGVGAYSLLLSVLVGAVCVVLNVVAAQLPERVRTIDVTGNRLYSVTPESVRVAQSLSDPVTLYFLVSQTDTYSKDTNVERLLIDYASHSDLITLEYVDTIVNPQFALQYTDTALSANSVVVENMTDGRFRAFDYRDMLLTEIDYGTMSQYVTGYDTEGLVTNALQAVTAPEGEMTLAGIVTGHGETVPEGTFRTLFERSGIRTEEINLQTVDAVPGDVSFLVVHAPLVDFTENETEKVLAFLEQGGNLLLVTTFESQPETEQIDRIHAFYGVSVQRGIVIERDPAGYYYSGTDAAPFYIFPLVYEDEVTKGIYNAVSGSVFVPMTQALSFDEADASVVQTPLMITSQEAFLKTDLNEAELAPSGDDIVGRQTLGLKSVKETEGGASSTAVFFASSQIFTESADEQVAKGMNSRLFSNVLTVLSGSDAVYVTVPAKSFYNTLTLHANAAIGWSLALIGLVFAIWAGGIFVWLYRRKL